MCANDVLEEFAWREGRSTLVFKCLDEISTWEISETSIPTQPSHLFGASGGEGWVRVIVCVRPDAQQVGVVVVVGWGV